MIQAVKGILASAAYLLLVAPSLADVESTPQNHDVRADRAMPIYSDVEMSIDEITRQITNPISPLWQVTFDNSTVLLDGGGLDDDFGYTSTIQPFMPIRLSRMGLRRFEWADDYRVVTRLTVPVFDTTPIPTRTGRQQKYGFGDIQLASVLAPSATLGFVWAVGPTFIFPSASNDNIGQGKWQAGPSAVAGYLTENWTAYAVAQQWWSFAGDDDRARTRQLCIEYNLLRNLPEQWQIGMQPSIEVDWTESNGNKLSFPVGLGVGKTFRLGKLPIQIWVEADYYVVRPDDVSSPRWGLDIQIVPVIGQVF